MLKRICSILLIANCSHVICGISSIDVKIFIGLLFFALVINAWIDKAPLRKCFAVTREDNILLLFASSIFFFGIIFNLVGLFHLKVFSLLIGAYIISILFESFLSSNIKEYFFLYKLTVLFNILSFCWFVIIKFGISIPLIYIPNPEGGMDFMLSFLGSSNTLVGNDIRPAGFFDEPGSFVFWNFLILGFGERRGLISSRQIFFNLFILLSTGSLMLLLGLLFYAIYSSRRISIGRRTVTSLILLLGIVLSIEILSPFSIISRLSIGYIYENNRSLQTDYIFSEFNLDVFLYGWIKIYGDSYAETLDSNVSSVFWVIHFIYGLVLAIVFYFIVVKAALSLRHCRHKALVLNFLLICYCRPYVYNLYWCIPFLLYYRIIVCRRAL